MSLKWLLQPVLLLNFCEGLALPPWAFYGKNDFFYSLPAPLRLGREASAPT